MDIITEFLESLKFWNPFQYLLAVADILISILSIIPPPLYILIGLAVGIFIIRVLVGLF